jgi:hypothetical protein
MVRITFEEGSNCLVMRIEGRFVAHFAEEAQHLIVGRKLAPELIVDVSEVTFADSHGEHALKWLSGVGAKFVAESSYALHLCERLDLPMKNGFERSPETAKHGSRHIVAETNPTA